jgi:hypothetical protein
MTTMSREALAKCLYEIDPRNSKAEAWHRLDGIFKEPYLIMAERFNKKFNLVKVNSEAQVEE